MEPKKSFGRNLKMKLRKLPDRTEIVTVVKKFISVDGVRIELPSDAYDVFQALRDTTYPTDLVRLFDKGFIEALIKCGFIKNGNRGASSFAVIANGKYFCTEKFRKCYKQLIAKVLEILYPEERK
jgi:hypothetical protein